MIRVLIRNSVIITVNDTFTISTVYLFIIFHTFCIYTCIGDSAGGHLAAALSIRWHREVLQKQITEGNGDLATSPLPPIRMQVLIYPVLQLVNMSFVSNIANVDVMHRRRALCREARLLAFPNRPQDNALLDALCAANHTTRATRERLAKYFHFGPVEGTEDEVRCREGYENENESVITKSSNFNLIYGTSMNFEQTDSLVTAEQRALAARVRDAEEHPVGDAQLEAELLPRLLDPEVSPLFMESFDELPNTYVVTVEFDALRDDGLLFVRRMRKATAGAGNALRVGHKHYPLYTHGFMNMGPVGLLQKDLSEFLRKNPQFF